MLSSTVTGGTWPQDITHERVLKEKGVGIEPGEEIPCSIRTTVWSFMGQATPTKYGKLVFGLPLSTREDFAPSSESIHGLLSGSSHQREEPEEDDEPMSDPYTRPSRFTTRGGSHQREEPRGGSHQREEPQQDTSVQNLWEDHRSSPGSPDQPAEEEPYFEEEDHGQEEAAALWVQDKETRGDLFHEQTTSSVSATNPWVLYEAGVICSRREDGSLEHNVSAERVLNLREWAYLLKSQRMKPRHQNIRRPEWKKLPWTAHLCYLFTRAWEIGRWKSHHKKAREFNEMRTLSERARARGVDGMRGERTT